eukprot:scaffold981_cov215-Prasinococcus_capsulatus_cf.AAC.2
MAGRKEGRRRERGDGARCGARSVQPPVVRTGPVRASRVAWRARSRPTTGRPAPPPPAAGGAWGLRRYMRSPSR